jgi:Cu(I)/Ag(I) efflux system membrane protein CusA/SilA
MGCADIATVLFTKVMKFDPADSKWADRDRFVLSAGHGSMLLYSSLYLLGYNQSVATGVGFIALAGVSAEFGVVMMIYLKHALADRPVDPDWTEVADAVREGALLRVRPKAMTVAVILAGLIPILIGTGTGSEVMSRIAAPMVGGMITAPLLSMLIIPAAYLLMRRPKHHSIVQHPQGEPQ